MPDLLTHKCTGVVLPELPVEHTEVHDHYYKTKMGKAYIAPSNGLD